MGETVTSAIVPAIETRSMRQRKTPAQDADRYRPLETGGVNLKVRQELRANLGSANTSKHEQTEETIT
jgi:hypothetical protein